MITGVYERTAAKYGDRAERYVHVEAGHATQNVLLECTALGLGAVPVGAFDDSKVQDVRGAPTDDRSFTYPYRTRLGRPLVTNYASCLRRCKIILITTTSMTMSVNVMTRSTITYVSVGNVSAKATCANES